MRTSRAWVLMVTSVGVPLGRRQPLGHYGWGMTIETERTTSTARAMVVGEDLQILDTEARELAPRARELLTRLPRGAHVDELQSSVVRLTSGEHTDPAELRAELRERRAELREASEELALSVAAAGSLPLVPRVPLQADETERLRQLMADYEMLARGQILAGMSVRVEVADRDEAVRVSRRVSAHLPTLVALTASSPFAQDGQDTGYASARSLAVYRWPTTGLVPPVETAREYDDLVARLMAGGVISDPELVRFGVQPVDGLGPDGLPDGRAMVELRSCDACPSVDTIVLVATLFRALVDREARALADGAPADAPLEQELRAALWRAARSGLEGTLVDVESMMEYPAPEVISQLVEELAEPLAATGDLELVRELTDDALHGGSSAFRQRRALRRRGSADDVVDLVVAETERNLDPGAADGQDAPTPGRGDMFDAYVPIEGVGGDDAWDEAIDADGRPREFYRPVLDGMASMGTVRLRARQTEHERRAAVKGITFRVTGEDRAQVLPMDVVPRVIESAEWERLARGIEQRERALDAFLSDVYGAQEFVRSGRLAPEALDRTPGYHQHTGRAMAPGRVRAHICGVDLVCTDDGRWVVLEDNLRMPSGAAFCHSIRGLSESLFPDILSGYDLRDPQEAYGMIQTTLEAAAPPAAGDTVHLGVLSSGPGDSGWYEHSLIAERTGAALVTPERIAVIDGVLHHRDASGVHRLDVVYARIDEEMLLSSFGFDGRQLRDGILEALSTGTLTIANALGNGVADDKAIYASVPEMIEFFLGEEPITDQVPTYICADRTQRDAVLERLDEMVVKPIDGYGGAGITIGPECTDEELAIRREELRNQPERFIAQEVVRLSTLPTFDGTHMQRRHVDLRAFVHVRQDGDRTTAHAVPTGLTRVAPAGSMIVNSSRGGGAKDTWILR